MKLIRRIKHWIWWNFIADEYDKIGYDMLFYGTGFMKNNKRINPKKLYNK